MNKPLLPVLTILLLLLFSCPSFSQEYRPGYIVQASGDTIQGLIKFRENDRSYKSCIFKKVEDAELKEYSPSNVSAYGFDNDKAIEVKTISTNTGNNEDVFAELLVKGRLSLYMYSDRFFVAKDSGQLQELSNKKEEGYVEDKNVVNGSNEYIKVLKSSNKHIVILNTLMNDCLSMLDKIERVYLSQRSLVNLVSDYNNCVAPGESILFKEKKRWLIGKPGFAGAANAETIFLSSDYPEFAYYHNASFNKRYFPSAGLVLNLASPRLKERLSLQVEAFYSSYDFVGYSEHTSNSGNTYNRNDYSLELSSLKFNSAFRYTFPARLVQPYVNIGISNRFLLSSKSLRIEEIETNKTVETNEHTDTFLQNQHTGVFGGVGANFNFFRQALFSELRYDRGLNIASPPQLNNVGRTLDGKSSTISLIAGFYF
ncbi:outer membrane beta-barrel protein [Pontibacter locisalis]|uniref:Outer membrane beta-barrel protein n=1 Tax=Pontibacter locisalis TaxID=1719035 RepID=A0ABW5IJN5_9BACT